MEYANWFVCVMGMGVVFIGLIVLILLVTAMSAVMKALFGKDDGKADLPEIKTATPAASASGRVTPEVIAAISVAVAEEMGSNVNAIRIISCKRV